MIVCNKDLIVRLFLTGIMNEVNRGVDIIIMRIIQSEVKKTV